MIHDLNKIPTIEEMRSDYELHCTKKLWDGITYYVHEGNCQCYNCEKTREKHKIDFPGIYFVMPRKVTVHNWDADTHVYQEFGGSVTETDAVFKASEFAKRSEI
jgi:hypothetical protein